LTLSFVAAGSRTIEYRRYKELCYEGPKIQSSETEYEVEIDTDETYELRHENVKSKAGWTPFDGMKVKGKVIRVTHKGKPIFEDDIVIIQPGEGQVLVPADY
jgi:hypothetical protein